MAEPQPVGSAPGLCVRGLKKSFPHPDGPAGARLEILDIERLDLPAGAELALAGASGSGKTTLLHAIAGIVRPDAGSIQIGGIEITRLGEAELDRWRARHLGYVFQNFQLLEGFSALENVCLPMLFSGRVDEPRARELLQRVGLGDRLRHRPRALSIGQRQRVAVARALACRPALVVADEPTGNLDRAHARAALELLRETCRANAAALLVVSHDPVVLEAFPRRLELAAINGARGARA
jgi:putative ABC transport system ATP-binding protein